VNKIFKFKFPANCVGCGFCVGVCPHYAISMNLDKYGFFRPELIKPDLCNGCKLCLDVCPAYNGFKNFYREKNLAEILIGHSLNKQVRMLSSSGGIITQFLINLFEAQEIDGAVVTGLTYEKNKVRTRPQLVHNLSELLSCASSKYIPVEFSQVISRLMESPERVAFVGLPCHIKALRLAQNNIKQLRDSVRFTVALLCGHCPSFFLIDYFSNRVPKKYGSIISVTFRKKKESGSNWPCISFHCEEGEIEFDWNESEFQRLFVDYYFTNKYCMICDDFASDFADISVGDAWLPELAKESKGTSIVLVRNPDITKYFDNMQLKPLSYEDYYLSQKGALNYRNFSVAERVSKHNLISKLSFIWYRTGLHWLISPKWLSRIVRVITKIKI